MAGAAGQGSVRLVKILVFGMLGLIILLTAIVVGTIVSRMLSGPAAAPDAAVTLPAGTRIEALDAATGRVLLLLSHADGSQSVVAIENGAAVPVALAAP